MKDPIVFHLFGISWSLGGCGIVLGGIFTIAAVIQFVILFKHLGGKPQRLSHREAERVAFYGGNLESTQVEAIHGPAVGVGVELNWDISTLRKAARRGDWLTFWLFVTMPASWIFGPGLVAVSVFLIARSPPWAVIGIGAVLLLGLAVFWFVPFAAIYTNLDAEPTDDRQPLSAPGDGGR
jgi:hypothetical protein